MARPLRIEFPGALYHVTARGDRRHTIFFNDDDRQLWLDILGLVCSRFNFIVHAYCQMSNHYHLMVETIEGNLSQGMRRLNSVYSQELNRRHGLVGHVFQGRYKAILVEKESYLLELARYVVLNPVRAKMVDDPADWNWGSYQFNSGTQPAPPWLDTQWVLSHFSENPEVAGDRYRQFVLAGMGKESPLKQTQHQIMLGDAAFVEQHSQGLRDSNLTAVVKDQRRLAVLTLAQYETAYPNRDAAVAAAYRSTAFTMREIGQHFGVSLQTVSRAVRRVADTQNSTDGASSSRHH